jgi:DNA-binding transcriptional MerR regulator
VHPEFTFSPPARLHLWNSLALTMSQAATLTGVSERQIQHWMDRGYIQPTSRGMRKLNGPNLDRILLIREARSAGFPLRQASRMADEYIAQEQRQNDPSTFGADEADQLRRQLNDLSVQLRSVLELLPEPPTPATRRATRSK